MINRKRFAARTAAVLILALCALPIQEAWADYPIQNVPFTDVELAPGFWADRLETNRTITLPHSFALCEETGRIANFARAAGLDGGEYEGFHFNDSDVYKVIEAASYILAATPDPALDAYVDDLIATIAAAQEEDGYLHPFITMTTDEDRWQNPHRHELYSIGHLIEAGAVHYQMTGKRALLEVAIRAADRVALDYNPVNGPLHHPPEHQQIEMGLVRLYRVTGEQRYLDLAEAFLNARGNPLGRRLFGEYSQDHLPVAEQSEAVGHSVRAVYQYSGMADVAALTGNDGFLQALQQLWENTTGSKQYVTGGIGSSGGNEGFGPPYDLPNLTAYSETCGSIGHVMWNERMFRLHGDARYVDLAERVLYNALLSGVSIEGDRFFYPNRLESFRGAQRSRWFDCSCCPSNVVRFMPLIPGLVYAHSGHDVYINLFMESSARIEANAGGMVIRQETRYPWDGAVRLTVTPDRTTPFTLNLRIPGWARGEVIAGDLYRFLDEDPAAPQLRVNDVPIEISLVNGYAQIEREWKAGDTVELDLPMPVRRIGAIENVVAADGRVALQRGPIVFCAEGIDNHDGNVLDLMIEDDTPFESEFRAGLLGGVQVLNGQARIVVRSQDQTPRVAASVPFTAIPYYAWAHRGPSPMQVWLARTPESARPQPSPTLASTSRVTASGGSGLDAVNNQLEPRYSGDHSVPFFHWWPQQNTTEWIQYDFREPTTVTGSQVYWFDDRNIGGGCRLPEEWRILYREGDEWIPVNAREVYSIDIDQWSRVSFQPITTNALRLEVKLPAHFSSGLFEWSVSKADL